MKAIIKILSVTLIILAVGCVSNETQIQKAIKQNPKIIFDLIEENPEQFVQVVNRAVQKAQQKQYEQQIAEIKIEQEKDLKNPKNPKLTDSRRLVGDEKAKITIVEYADFQCPACKMAFESLNHFKEKYKGQVQFYYKHMPLDFHKMALPAALYFEAIRKQDQKKSLKFYNLVFQNQKQMKDENFLNDLAKKSGADMKKLLQDVKSDRIKQIVEEDMNEFQNFGFTGTPVILINGVAMHGAQGMEELERVARLTGGL